jgi:hypothetical protein
MLLSSVSGGGIGWVTQTTSSSAGNYGAEWQIYGNSPVTQTFTVTCTFTQTQAGYYNMVRWYVFGSHGGIGYSGSWRSSGEPWLYVNQTTQKSAFIHAHVDWNATSPSGSFLTEAGPISYPIIFRGGAGIYWLAANLDSTGITQKRVGAAGGATSTRITGGAMEIKGIYVDTDPPSTVTGITATVLGPDSIRVDWAAATDDVGVTGYRVFDGGIQVGADLPSSARTLTITGLAPLSSHSYTVRAFDAVGHMSAIPTAVPATTASPYIDRAKWMDTRPGLYLGTTAVGKLYVGDTQIWP